jgi:diamine N-acetyltransferase
VVSLRPITDANREEVEALVVTPDQGRFVSGVRESIREAEEEPAAHALYWAIYAEEAPVGFVMIADEVDDPDYIAHYLWKLLIDERYQRRGFGTATLDLVVEYFRNRGVGIMWTSAGQGEGSPIAFYERYGFTRTGDPHGDEIMLRLDIP